MDKAITTALLIIISMVMALSLFNIAYPAIQEGGDAITGMASRAEDRIRTQILIIHASSELDADGNWQDSNGNGVFEAFVWVKNIGDSRIIAADNLDVFFGKEGNFSRLVYDDGFTYPRWSWMIENDTEWDPGATGRITIQYAAPITSDRYYAKVITPEGISDEYYFGI